MQIRSCRLVCLAVLMTIAGAPRSSRAAEAAPPEPRTISVTGQGEVKASPDLAVLAVAVETQAGKADGAVDENARRSARVATALKALLGSDDHLTTTRYTLEPQRAPVKPGETGEARIVGWVARNQVQVETHKVNAVGRLIDTAITAGANYVSGLQFTLSNRNERLRAALAQAGAEARAQAESVAQALGVKLKAVASAVASTAPIIQPRYLETGTVAALAARPPTPLEPGLVTVSATLQVKYSIE